MPEAPVLPVSRPRTINLIVGLIRSYMELEAEQVVVYNQKWRIPNDDRLYVTVAYLAQKPFGPCTSYEKFGGTPGNPAGLKEVVTVNSQETFSINVYSRNEDAVQRKDEVVMALNSTAAQQLCEANSIKLGRIPVGMSDLSGQEGTAIVNRFALTINALVARSREKVVEYYDKFQPTGLLINP